MDIATVAEMEKCLGFLLILISVSFNKRKGILWGASV
jgi:hypothetical protein